MIEVRRLVWDDFNVEHIARHEVRTEEVEEVCHGNFLLLQGKKGRLVLIGPTEVERLLAVVLAPWNLEGAYYAITARPAARSERKLYQQTKGGEKR